MFYKEYGKTGIQVSAVGFGGMRFVEGVHYKDGRVLDAGIQLVHKASEGGINYFDTAPGYCAGMSEAIFGEAFLNMPHPYYVSTKCGLMDAGECRRTLESSLKLLKKEKIDFYHAWCILSMDNYREVMKKGGLYEGMIRAKEEGLVDHLVFSTHAMGAEIAAMVKEHLFEGVLLGYNATNFKFRQEGIREAAAQGLGVVTMNPLGGGVIPQNEAFYSFLKEREDQSVAEAALRFNLSQKEISITLPGISNEKELEAAVRACDNLTEMTEGRKEALARYITDNLNTLCTGCGYCKGCPANLPIPKLMDSYNMKFFSPDGNEVRNRLKWHWHIPGALAENCVKCGRCERLCTQHLPIMARLEELVELTAEA